MPFIWKNLLKGLGMPIFGAKNLSFNNKGFQKKKRLSYKMLIILCLLTGSGIGTVFGSLIIGYARNPSLKNNLFTYAVLGFALSEAMGLFCFLLAAGILFAF